MSYYAHHFSAPLEIHRLGRYRYRVVYLPAALAAELPFDRQPRVRFDGEIADVPVQGAWQSAGAAGRRYAMVSPEVCRAAGLTLGALVEVRFNVADPNAVQLPEELAAALDADALARAEWDALTPGRRRGLAHRVAAARKETTRHARAAELIAGLRAGQLPGPPPRSRDERR